MGIGRIFQNFSWDTLMSLPPSELLSLVVLWLLACYGLVILLPQLASIILGKPLLRQKKPSRSLDP